MCFDALFVATQGPKMPFVSFSFVWSNGKEHHWQIQSASVEPTQLVFKLLMTNLQKVSDETLSE